MMNFSLKHGIVGVFLGALSVFAAQAQYTFEQPSRTQNANDPRNRAKIHTELGAMYFQGGSMSVALDELGIALAADSSYFQAYSIRGLVYGALKEYGKAESDFQRALSLAPNDPEVNNNYASRSPIF